MHIKVLNHIRIFITVVLAIILQGFVFAQGPREYVVIQEIHLNGNEKTESRILFRELDYFPGDTLFLDEMVYQLKLTQNRLLSTGLFTDVIVNLSNWKVMERQADINIAVQENWYLYPSIIFGLADRNFNVWWKEMNRSLDRVNYGLRLDHINLTGNRDKFKAKAQFGYTRKFEIKYEYPYLDNKWGYAASVLYSDNKEIGYQTIGNKTIFEKLEDERKLLYKRKVGGALNYRPTLFDYHTLRLEYNHNSIDKIVADELNHDYFLNGNTELRFFMLEYTYDYDKRVFFQYPIDGHRISLSLKKEGLGVIGNYNNFLLYSGGEIYLPFRKWIFANRLKFKVSLIRDKVAFANNTGLGYGEDNVNGYELYVLDGTDFGIFQSSLRYNIVDKFFNLGSNMPIDQFKKMSFKVFLRFNVSAAYVHEPTYKETNFLNNQIIVGYGPAIDLVLWNNFILKAEYSFNELGEHGFIFKTGSVF